jgi:hypothetical protein
VIHGLDRGQLSSATGRSIDLEGWANAGVQLLRAPRDLVTELQQRHLPQPGTTVIAVLDRDHRVVASASASARPHVTDGWQHRNVLLTQLRQITHHDLRLPVPRRTAVLLRCHDGADDWSEQDGAWMWALRDAATLHGLRCGAYVTLTPSGWHVFGEDRSGRTPHAGSWAERPLHTVSELPVRASAAERPDQETSSARRGLSPTAAWPRLDARAEPARRAAR